MNIALYKKCVIVCIREEAVNQRFRMAKKLLVDVDCGVDDAQAIMMALAVPDVQILGVTCVHGNTTTENVCKNVLRVLKACCKLEIPVFRGASKPILGITRNASYFHGVDGLGDAPDPEAPGLDMVQKEGAVSAMIRIATEHPGEFSTLNTCVRREKKVLSCVMARGNTTVCGEFNFVSDPEAAYIVLNDYLCPVYITSWEFTCRHKLPWEFCDEWLSQDNEKAKFMKRIFQHSMNEAYSPQSEKELVDGFGFVSCDSYAMAAAVDDSFVTEYEQVAVTVELAGTCTRGMMVLDTLELLNKKHKAFLLKRVDMDKFKSLLINALK
ncbi:inosine-uridine preferring nucleoside hydrolase-like isoform X2 [Paramormyrops kingsleyae]|uniref:inosine-uridine preferring nucleoside hydrolase-like isoform X2 n=1 Tax=Paramormyrops kingsleyae TaxID=1676925 RepID=UPI000CD5E6B8|nr:inosine-uridine preferring nucleoside hydrolase-like isoform X2 [Paramormyrops kingsleyae]